MKRSKLATILKRAEIISKAIEAETEEILEDAEKAVKETVPACSTVAVLAAIEKKLEKEGIEVLFQKSISKEAMAKTAADALDDKEVDKIVDKIVDAIVEELEDVLKDADEVCDDEVKKLGDGEEAGDFCEVEGKLKGILEKKLAGKGIYAGLARTVKKAPTKSAAEKAVEALASKRSARK